MGVTDTGSGWRVGCDNCDAELNPSDMVLVWRSQRNSTLGPSSVQARGCEGCIDAALKEEFAQRGASVSFALRSLRGEPLHLRETECHYCGRKMVFVTETKYNTPYTRRAYCSDACRDASGERVKRERAARHRVVCEVCATLFISTRNDARTCSPACRQKAYRQRSRCVRTLRMGLEDV